MITNFKKLFLSVIILLLAVCGYSKSFYYYYETRLIPSGFSTLGMSVNSYPSINYLFPTNGLPDGFTVYKQIQTPSGPTWGIYSYDAVFGGWNFDPSDTNTVINHGESVILFNPSNSPVQQVFVGDVIQNSTTLINSGFNLISTKTLKSGGISKIHGLSPNEGDMIYKLVGASWSIYTFEDGGEPNWTPSEPELGPFEGFWYFNATSTKFNWIQNDYLPNIYNSLERRFLISAQYYDPSFIAGIMCIGTKLNTEQMLTFSYSTTINNPSWFIFSSYGPGLQPNDEQYTGFWAAQPFSKYGYIRVSTW